MAETESEALPTSGFKVRPLLRVAKAEPSKADGSRQTADGKVQDAENGPAKPSPEKKPESIELSKERTGRPRFQHQIETAQTKRTRLRELTDELCTLEAKLRRGGTAEFPRYPYAGVEAAVPRSPP